jgi:MSHA biogenesis protein MshO
MTSIPMPPPPLMRPALARGFTLIELIVVIVVTSIVATGMAVFLRPALDAHRNTRLRAELSDQADTALRRMVRDVRASVPNSIRIPSPQCFEMVPTVSGARYRLGPDVVNDSTVGCVASATCAAWVDPASATQLQVFDTLTTLSKTPEVGDWVVINNQIGNDVYEGNNRSAITGLATPSASTQGKLRITLNPMTVSGGYSGGRFLVVDKDEQAVFYICSGADGTLDSQGNGKGTLYRLKRNFNATYPASCPATTGADVMATRVRSCTFVYDPNQGATQQNGFLWLNIDLARSNENASLSMGAHVMNAP